MNEWQQMIISVLSGRRKVIVNNKLTVPPSDVKDFLVTQGLTPVADNEELGIRNGFATNGWDYDWWLHYERDGQEYTASGSGYYGGFTFENGD